MRGEIVRDSRGITKRQAAEVLRRLRQSVENESDSLHLLLEAAGVPNLTKGGRNPDVELRQSGVELK